MFAATFFTNNQELDVYYRKMRIKINPIQTPRTRVGNIYYNIKKTKVRLMLSSAVQRKVTYNCNSTI